jgi:hypothetical protein
MADKQVRTTRVMFLAMLLLGLSSWGCSIGYSAPPNATVYIDSNNEYLAPSCADLMGEPSTFRAMARGQMTVSEAREKGIPRQRECIERGGFSHSRSLPGALLQEFGLLSDRWNEDGSWNW